jgi:hypothetical protein
MNWKAFGRKWSWLNRHNIPGFMKTTKRFRIAVVPSEIRREHLLTEILEHYIYANLFGFAFSASRREDKKTVGCTVVELLVNVRHT